MLIIGHRGAAGLAPENSIEALQKGYDVGADMLEFDVQLTRDKVPIVIHDSTLLRTHKSRKFVRWNTHQSIAEIAKKGHAIATLEEVLDMFFGKVLLNLEVKSSGTGKIVTQLIKERYIKKPDDWQLILFSSFKIRELVAVRNSSREAAIAFLHDRTPFNFMLFHRKLQFSAVGFHRLHISPLALEVAKQLDLFTYAYTVNRPKAAQLLEAKGIDGVVTDNPEYLRQSLSS